MRSQIEPMILIADAEAWTLAAKDKPVLDGEPAIKLGMLPQTEQSLLHTSIARRPGALRHHQFILYPRIYERCRSTTGCLHLQQLRGRVERAPS